MNRKTAQAAYKHYRKSRKPHACPTKHKIGYSAEWSALNALTHISPDRPEQRAYKCQCGKWHLTSKARPKQEETP